MQTEQVEQDVNPLIQEAQDLNQEDSDIIGEIASLDKAEAAEETPVETSTAPAAEQPPVAIPPVQTSGPDSAILRQQLEQAQTRLQEFERQQAQVSLETEVGQYQNQLEEQGLMPEQARPVAQQYRQFRQREMQLQQMAQTQQQNALGKFYAALHFSQLHGADPRELMQYDTPQAMEAAAKTQSELKTLKAEVQKLKQGRVPASTLETGQVAPVSARTESGWLDAYNNGDRSERAQAAGRRAAGL